MWALGVGKHMKALATAGFHVVGIEPSAPFVRRAREQYGFAADQLLEKRLEECDFPECSFDFVNLAAVLEHLPEPGCALEKAMQSFRRHARLHEYAVALHRFYVCQTYLQRS